MSDPLFQEAYARARSRFTESGWLSLSPREITEAIYGEIRQIDAERVAMQPPIGIDESRAAMKGAVPKGEVSADGPSPVARPGRKPRAKTAAPTTRRPAPQLG